MNVRWILSGVGVFVCLVCESCGYNINSSKQDLTMSLNLCLCYAIKLQKGFNKKKTMRDCKDSVTKFYYRCICTFLTKDNRFDRYNFWD